MEIARRFVAAIGCAVACGACATPFTPSSDAEVVERLPAMTDPSARHVESLRKQLSAHPQDHGLRLEIARRYFELAMAQGDPRYVGYAQASIAPLAATAAGNAQYWLVRGLLQQYGHDFSGAADSLARANRIDPSDVEPIAWRAAIAMVQARYEDARSECQHLVPIAHPLHALACTAYVQAATGQLAQAYGALAAAVAATRDTGPGLMLWVQTRLAEMAIRLQRWDVAEQHFRVAQRLGITDQFLLGAYADFLLERRRPAEVLRMLSGWERSDILLLRLALAGRATRDPRASDWARQLRERFDAAQQRGDRLHEQEAARFALDIEANPQKALELAQRNYDSQKEPRDAEILMRAALAARSPQAAKPALAWLHAAHHEDPHLNALAAELAQGMPTGPAR